MVGRGEPTTYVDPEKRAGHAVFSWFSSFSTCRCKGFTCEWNNCTQTRPGSHSEPSKWLPNVFPQDIQVPTYVYIKDNILNAEHAELLTLSSRLRISSASSSLISLRSPSSGVDSSRHSFFASGFSTSLSDESLGRLPEIGRSGASPDFLLELSSNLRATVLRTQIC